MFTAPCRLTINVRSWSSPAILPSSSVLWLCSGQIWSSVRPGEILSSHREWSKYLLSCQHLVEFGFRLTVPIPGTAAFEISYSVDDPKHFWERLPILHTLMWFVTFTFCSIYLVMFILLFTNVFTLPSIYPQQLVLELRSGLRDLLSCLPQLHSWHVQWTAHVPASVSSVYV